MHQYVSRAALNRVMNDHPLEYLCHFTRIANLENILTHGLLRLDELEKRRIRYANNDQSRWEIGSLNIAGEYRSPINLSINCINTKLLTAANYRPIVKELAILLLDPQLLCELECAFTHTNAANGRYTSDGRGKLRTPEGLASLKTEEAFFEILRTDLGSGEQRITDDVQAEVLVFDSIPPKYIKKIVLYDREHMETLSGNLREKLTKLGIELLDDSSKLYFP